MLAFFVATLVVAGSLIALHIAKGRAAERALFAALLREAAQRGVPVWINPALVPKGNVGMYRANTIYLVCNNPWILAHELGHDLAFPDLSEAAANHKARELVQEILGPRAARTLRAQIESYLSVPS